jgi:hypothetical protein
VNVQAPLAAAVALAVSPGVLKRVVATAGRAEPDTASATDTAVPEPPASLDGHADRVMELFAVDLAAGTTPGIRRTARTRRSASRRPSRYGSTWPGSRRATARDGDAPAP